MIDVERWLSAGGVAILAAVVFAESGLLIGFFLQAMALVKFGVLLFSAAVLFQIVTLPVEFNASRRALVALEGVGILSPDEMPGARRVLSAAALTYVAAAIAAVMQLVYFLLPSGLLGGGRRD